MKAREAELDITKSLRAIEWLKTELLGAVTLVFRALAQGCDNIITDALTQIILIVYLLGNRLGVGFASLDQRLSQMVRQSLSSGHELETWYGDLSALKEYLNSKR
ncbi:MAG TPA: MazG-like family protein [bacterium]|nr:MazG-like family protein [bacterium]